MSDLSSVTSACVKQKTPILRKDFILDPIQIAQAVVAGADAILAIVAVLGEKTTTIVKAARDMGIDVIVEVHTEAELMQALASGADIIGVNNRNLCTFAVDVERAFQLLPQVPKGVITIAESGIAMPHLAREYHRAGFDAVLMGEALVTSDSKELVIRQCRTPLATKVKICGVRSVAMATAAVDAGADWIGIVSHPSSTRHVDLQTAVAIAAATRNKGATPVAVFVDQNAQEMKTFCDITGIEVVQLHGANARHHHAALPTHYQRLYVVSVDESGMLQDDLAAIATCDAERDYVLFDHVNAGLGQVFPWDKLNYRGPLAVGIAGGVRASNVRAVMARFQPAWIDVSSGVERTLGEKDIELIERLVTTVKQMES